MSNFNRAEWLSIIIILLGAMALRGAGIGQFGRLDDADFPRYSANSMLHQQAPVHADEYFATTIPVDMRLDGRLNPDFFEYPSGLFYLNYVVFGLTGAENPITAEAREGESLRTYAPFGFYFMSRVWSVLSGVIVVASAMSIMNIVSGRMASMISGTAIALSTIMVQHAHYAKPEALAIGTMMMVIWASVIALYSKKPSTQYRYLILAGFCTGLSTTIRFNAAAISIILCVSGLVLLYRHRDLKACIAVLVAWALFPIIFVLGTPAIIVDFAAVYEDFTYIAGQFLASGANVPSIVLEEPLTSFFLLTLHLIVYGTGIICAFCCIVGVAIVLKKHPQNPLSENSELLFISMLLLFLVPYMLVTMRTIRPFLSDNLLVLITPQWLLVAGIGGQWIYEQLRGLSPLILKGIVIASVGVFPAMLTIPLILNFTQVDTRIHLQKWIYNNIPTGAEFLLVESYNVPLDSDQYPYDQIFNILTFELEDVTGYDYLVLSQTRVDVYDKMDVLVTEEEFATYGNIVQSINENFSRVTGVESYEYFGANWLLSSANYWHQPTLTLYCLNQNACDVVADTSQ